jgi:aryl-phospho-beta-D-glucosidase BglC (GH1 family)
MTKIIFISNSTTNFTSVTQNLVRNTYKNNGEKLIPKLGKSFEMASSWLKWLHLGGFSTHYALSLDKTTQIGSTFQLIHLRKKFLNSSWP